ncbi:MAG: hypothetical protein H7122_11555 [Chitinophagaceae bacterium]|nr:hypothetical protein [Chitinophagaceae bacterium]
MKHSLFIFLLLLRAAVSLAQENESPLSGIEQQIENQAEMSETEPEDDSYLQQLAYYTRHPLNLNTVEPNELREFKMLSDLQIQNFFLYRNLLGPFVNKYELQAIPTWDILTIKKLIPYIIVAESKTIVQNFRDRLSGGDKNLLLRFSMIIPKARGYFRDSSSNFYNGSRPHILARYKYVYKNLLQYGVTGDKDAGEQFLRGSQKQGFDFYSFHLFVRKSGIVKSLAIGDFTANLGQGLIHWQSMAFKKSGAITAIKRQTDVLRPYSSSGEYNFHRGAGITVANKNWEATAFGSIRKLSASIKTDTLQNQEGYVSSLLNSGYHRSLTELANRNNLQSIVVGSNIQYSVSKWNAGINYVQYFFSKPFKGSGKPYALYAIEGKKWTNFSFDYSYTFRNVHLFGEIAADRNFNTAIVKGMIASIDRSIDLAILYRSIGKRYQSIYGNAFTENNLPGNENGLYTGITIRPVNELKVDVYADFYKFAWLQYQTDAPAYGSDYLLQLTYNPTRKIEVYIRYKRKAKQSNGSSDVFMSPLIYTIRKNIRYQVSYSISREISVKNRIEVLWYEKDSENRQNGYMCFTDIHYKSYARPFSGNMRLGYFETDGFESRVYTYENDLPFSYSTPAFFDKGFRLYINIRTDVSKWALLKKDWQLELHMKYAFLQYFELDKIGTELDEIQGKRRSEIKLQLLFSR